MSQEELDEFKSEALELLDAAEKNLLALDSGEDFKIAFDTIFRSFHNLKGASGMMDLTDLQSHTHELESILMEFKSSTSIPRDHINLFLRGIDGARSILDGQKITFDFTIGKVAEVSTAPVTTPPIVIVETKAIEIDPAMAEFLAESEEMVDRISDALQRVEQKTSSQETIEALYRDIHSLKGAAFLFSFNAIGEIAHAMESSMDGVRSGTQQATPELINTLFKCVKALEQDIQSIKSGGQCEEIRKCLPEITNALSQQASGSQPKVEIPMDPVEIPVVAEKVVQAPVAEKDGEGNSSIRVPVSLLDNLMTLMGEMVLVRNQVLQFSNKTEDLEFLNLSKRLNVVTSEIQGEMMKTRMQPIGNVLSKFQRVVRDLSQELKKEITLNLQGADTELDKSLLEAIKDPLTHIVRNSCDHGIETPEVRVKSGKAKGGNIQIRSFHEGGQVIIEITDDGKGLHKEVLLKKAIEKGIIQKSQASTMTEKEIYNLIFAPGFSTAAAITNVSGRGVGMDVVRTNVEKIGGSVELHSEAGKGTTTRLKIPLTLAIIPALVVRCAGGTFAIPQVKLEELVRVDQSSSDNKIEYLHGAPIFRLRGNILPLVSLDKILGLPSTGTSSNSIHNIAVLNADQCSFGLIIDEIQDTADIVVKPINRLLKSLQVYSGATILGDGDIALILDVIGIAKVAQIENSKAKLEENSKKTSSEQLRSEKQDFLIVRLNSPTKHAIVLNYVHRLEEFERKNIEYSGQQAVIRYGKSILPLLSLNEQLHYTAVEEKNTLDAFPVVVIEKAGVLFGLVVNEILDTLSTDCEVDCSLVKQSGFFGNLNTAEELIVVLDPFTLINSAFPEHVEAAPIATVAPVFATRSSYQKTSLKILLAEDTIFFRKAVAAVLTKEGHEVTIAVDGKEALDVLNNSGINFDLLISDIEMPRMNGFELAKAVRSHKVYANMRMLALSSRADKRYIEMGKQAGFDCYLEKLKPTLLVDTIAALTAERKAS